MQEQVPIYTLETAIKVSWSKKTSADPARWSEKNPAWGQCAVTALVVNDFFGGELLRIDISEHKNPKVAAMMSHYFNRINGKEIDLTSSEFSDDKEFASIKKSQEPVVKTREHLSGYNFLTRYELLRLSVAERLSENHHLFANPTYRKCLSLALKSNCQKGKYGCVVFSSERGGITVAETYNRILEPLKDWCKPECIRMKIPSRTESMIGCCGHAEELAIVEIRNAGLNPYECDLFVAGFHSNGLAYIKPEPDFTCIRCATQLYLHGVGNIFVPTSDGWKHISAKEALRTSMAYATQEKKTK